MDEKNQFWKGLAAGIGIAFVIAVSAVLFGKFYAKMSAPEPSDSQEEEAELNLTDPRIQKKLSEIEDLMNKYYLDEIDSGEVEACLYKGALAGLGDLYAAYYTQEEYQSLLDSTSGSYCGIGVEMSQNIATGIITVTRVFEGSPAGEAGMLPGDVFYMVEDTEVTGEDLTKVVSLIKGEEFTDVTIYVAREGESDYLEFQVERRTIEVPTVSYEMLENQIGYIAISNFDDVTTDQFLQAMDALEAQNMKALIVDLRNNGGGLVSSVRDILDRLLPEGLLVYTEDKYGVRENEVSDAEHFFDKPMAVLINGNSASASEIFAGAIKDYEAGTLVGTKTFGKGIVQKIFPLSDGTGVKLTVSKYYTPKGNNIHGIGIEPDVEIELEESLKREAVIPKDQDNQLQKALELLKEEIAGE